MIILGIETSGRSGSIAVVEGETVLGETELSATGRRHARTLVPEIGALMTQLEIVLQDVAGIAVSIGPGSFTGLRVGVVCAKTLAYALQKPVLAIDTFWAIANRIDGSAAELWVIDDALRGDVYAGQYRFSDEGVWEISQSPRLLSMEEFASQLTAQSHVAGPGVLKLADELPECQTCGGEFHLPQAAQVALLGERRLLQNGTDDVWAIEPHYIRRSAAEERSAQSS